MTVATQHRNAMWIPRVRLLACSSVVLAAIIVSVASAAALTDNIPWLMRGGERAAVRLHNPPPPGDEFASVNRVTQWPADWVDAVCESPVYHLRTPNPRLPHAKTSAACKARIQPNGEYVDLTIARFDAELPMQVDLFNRNYTWYAFAYDRGKVMAFATFSEAEAIDPKTNFTESPVLQPLKRFGFDIYSHPGP